MMPPSGEPLTYVCDWLPPDFGAVGQYSQKFAQDYAAQDGRAVTLIGLTSERSVTTRATVGPGSLTVVKLRASPVPKDSLAKRMLWTIGTNLRLAGAVIRHTRFRGSVLFTGSPPYFLHFITPMQWFLRYRLIYRITDFHPECLMATMKQVPAPLRALYRLTIWRRRRVDRFQVLGEDQRKRLEELDIAAEKIDLKRDPSPVTFPQRLAPGPRPQAPDGAVLLLYSGNLGEAHDVETFLEGYLRHHREGAARVWLWLNAVGKHVSALSMRLESENAPFIHGELAPLDQLASLLTTPEAHLITLKDEFVGFALPSKVYGCIESGRDVLFVGSERSDVDLVARTQKAPQQLYIRASVGDADGVFQALETLGERHVARSTRGDAATAPPQGQPA